MRFKINEYHRDISKDDLIRDLCVVAKKLNISYLSRSVYEKNGKYSATPYIGKFGSWLAACKAAGLKTVRSSHDYNKCISDMTLLHDMYLVAKQLKVSSISTKDYAEYGKYSVQTILSRFSTWSEALTKANLEQTGFKIISDKDLFDEIERIWIKKGKQPTTTDIKNGLSKYSLNSYARRFGGWRRALEAFVEYISGTEAETGSFQPETETIIADDVSSDDSKNVGVIGTNKGKPHRASREINTQLRFKVLKRDNFKCCACGASPAKDPSVELHVDHIVPWAKGGETVTENLQTLCSKCNLGKSDLL